MGYKEAKIPPHVLIFSLPAQAHLNTMLNLAQLLCLSDFHVTFIMSEFNDRRLLKHHTNIHSTFARFPGFQFKAIPDGLHLDGHMPDGRNEPDAVSSVINTMWQGFKKMVIEEDLLASANRRPVTCIIADGMLNFAADFAEEIGIPLIYFPIASASGFWAFFCADRLIEANEIPVQENGLDELVNSIPGMQGLLRCRDLPSFFRANDVNYTGLRDIIAVAKGNARAKAIIFDTFEDIEQPVLTNMLKDIPRIYTIGPSNAHLKSRLVENKIDASTPSASLWTEDRNCIDWLNAQKQNSVIYVSFGSITVVTREQLLEFWHGLVNSGQRFLWVIRPDLLKGDDGSQIPPELEKGTKENGYIVGWAPQEEVLNHSAVGAFLTHSGWISTLESIVAGVPMICWAYFTEQMVISRFVSEVWKIGLDIKDTCDRVVIENAIRELMEVRKDEFLEMSDHWAKRAKVAVREGGSSYDSLNGLVDYIESFIM